MRTTLQRCHRGGRASRQAPALLLLSVIVAAVGIVAIPVGAQESLRDPVRAKAPDPASTEAPAEETAQPTDSEATPSGESSGGEASSVELDQLLRLPNTLDFREERKGGVGASDWRRRFREAEERIVTARSKLAQVETDLDSAAGSGGSQWQIAPPGQSASSDTGPLSFRLREELRRTRADLEEAERQLRALEVEADLAEVPESWRRPLP